MTDKLKPCEAHDLKQRIKNRDHIITNRDADLAAAREEIARLNGEIELKNHDINTLSKAETQHYFDLEAMTNDRNMLQSEKDEHLALLEEAAEMLEHPVDTGDCTTYANQIGSEDMQMCRFGEDTKRAQCFRHTKGKRQLLANEQEQGEVCVWRWEPEFWATGCDNAHTFFVAGPKENKHMFCPYCGKPIREEETDGESTDHTGEG